MRMILSMAAFFIIIWVLLFSGLLSGVSALETEINLQKELIGREIVFNSDTLIITDYSMVMSTYSLSNGSTIHVEFARQYLVPLEGGEMVIEAND